MIKCFFADIKSISSEIDRTEFNESEIEHLADVILATDGLIRPLILKQTGLEQYTVVEGNLEYYAAVRAKEKDSRRAEMVNAFVVPANHQQFAIEQITLLSGARANPIASQPNISESIEQLTSIIAQQLQPLQQQLSTVVSELAEHKNILKSFSSGRIESVEIQPETVNVDLNTLVTAEQIIDSPTERLRQRQQPDVTPSQEPAAKIIESKPPSTTTKKIGQKPKATKTPAKSKSVKSDKIEIDKPVEAKVVEVDTVVDTKSTTAKKTKSTTKPKVELDPSINPIKAANTLMLINTLTEKELLFKMEKSGVSPIAIKLISTIIDKRNTQPEQKFDNWETMMSEVTGLKSVTIKNIINKLK